MTEKKSNHSRFKRRFYSKRAARPNKSSNVTYRLDRALKDTFAKIGVPESLPFKPDPFQLQALEKIKEHDVLVSAPTGSGKTWIASRAIEQYLKKGLKVWYASPLKALSNSLYLEFSREFGPEACGILTGERKENSEAPVIVGTTEILRNQLYDSMHEGTSLNSDLVILDEAHYLSDPDRGVVWEEVLIYMPPRVRLLLLSATISNAEEVALWLEKNRGTSSYVVRSNERPVPLEMLFLFPDGLISPLVGKKGLSHRVKKFISSQTDRGRMRYLTKPRFGDILSCLKKFNLLPAIFFLKSRKDCDKALEGCPSSKRNDRFNASLKREMEEFIREYPHLSRHRQISSLLNCRVASHHAGQLPYWKVLIEKMMNKGHLDAIFSTSTVAAGVNFPARTVVLVQSDRFNGHEFADLTSTDLHQMIGRAGRRGKDNIGFALVVPGIHQDPKLIQELVDSPPEPLLSQIRINFSMTLNLLLSNSPLEIKTLLDLSFTAFQRNRSVSILPKRWNSMAGLLKRILADGNCDTKDPYEVMENIRRRSELRREAKAFSRKIRGQNLYDSLRPYLEKGRLFNHKDKGIYVIFSIYRDQGKIICQALNTGKKIRARKGKIRFRKVEVSQIRWLYDYKLDISPEYSMAGFQEIMDGIDLSELKRLDIGNNGFDIHDGLIAVREKIKQLPCEECIHFKDCHTHKNRDLNRVLKDLTSFANKMDGSSEILWISFKRHLRFLKETNFVDDRDRLTPDGIWASKLRLDQPLLIAEAIRKGGFSALSPEVMAGCIAVFVWDREQDVETRTGESEDLIPMEEAFNGILESMEDVRDLKVRRGFANPPIMFWPAAACFMWARGASWDDMLFRIPIGEGDMASMITRTADHLRQVVNLRDTHPELSDTAGKAIDLILREPVFIP